MRPTAGRSRVLTLVVALALSWSGACGGDRARVEPPAPAPAPPITAAPRGAADTRIPDVTYAWDPQAGDPSVPPELGGPGFTGAGWTTRMTFPALGDARALEGGSLRRSVGTWPVTLRLAGADSHSTVNAVFERLAYESLLFLHPTLGDFVPQLATHWQVSADGSTYRYRINPAARFSDGSEVTASDVVATYAMLVDPALRDPASVMTFQKFEKPVALSKYLLEVKVKEPSWRNHRYFSTFAVFPAKAVNIPGAQYMERYQSSYVPGSGPYAAAEGDIVVGQRVTFRRRADWWDAANPAWIGYRNLDAITYEVVADPRLAMEKLKKGELDYQQVVRSQQWVEELPAIDAVRRGLVQRRKFFTQAAATGFGLACNMGRPPLDDVRVREALARLLDRETLIAKLFFGEYLPLASYFPGTAYANPANVPVAHDEARAVQLLEEAGWKEIASDGVRIRGGKRLKLTLVYRAQTSEPAFTLYQESCRRAGVELELRFVSLPALQQAVGARDFDLVEHGWRGEDPPNPETAWSSALAGTASGGNVSSFADPRVDELCRRYDTAADATERLRIVREIDAILLSQHPFILEWYVPAQRVAYWNRYSMPPWGTARTADWDDLFFSWWLDPEREKQLDEARRDETRTLPVGDVDVRFWQDWRSADGVAPATK